MSRCKLEALHPLHSSSPQAHGSSEHKHVSGQGKYLERGITDTESCEVYVELQVWRGHIIVRQFSEVKDSLSKYLSFCPLFFVPLRAPSAPPHHIPFPSFHTSKDSIAHYVVWKQVSQSSKHGLFELEYINRILCHLIPWNKSTWLEDGALCILLISRDYSNQVGSPQFVWGLQSIEISQSHWGQCRNLNSIHHAPNLALLTPSTVLYRLYEWLSAISGIMSPSDPVALVTTYSGSLQTLILDRRSVFSERC